MIEAHKLIIHNNLNENNILLFKINGRRVFKITDFGGSHRISNKSNAITIPKEFNVTSGYQSPEVKELQVYEHLHHIK